MAGTNSRSTGYILEEEYERRIANASGINPVFSHVAKEQMRSMAEQIARTNDHLKTISSTDQRLAVKAGFAAEEWHAETFNLDAILKDTKLRASTDKYGGAYGWEKKNGLPDVKVHKNGSVVEEYQLKFYKDADTTSKQMRQLNSDGTHKYKDMGLVGPADQIQGIKSASRRTFLKEDAKGARLGVRDAAKSVEENVSATVECGGVQSSPLTKKGAENIARDENAKAKIDTENRYKTRSTTKEMQEAASGAAAMSAIVAGTVNIVRYTQLVREGKLAPSEAAIKIAAETAASAADSAVKAAATTGAQSLIIRYGSQELISKIAGKSVGALVRSNAVSVAAVCAIDAIKDIVLFGAGKITAEQLEERAGRNILSTSAATMGGSLGALVCGGLEAATFTAAVLPIVGGLAGGLIASMAMDFAIENGIEAPYRELVSNAVVLRDSARLLDEVSKKMYRGQVVFESFLIEDADGDRRFKEHNAQSAELSDKLGRAIDRI